MRDQVRLLLLTLIGVGVTTSVWSGSSDEITVTVTIRQPQVAAVKITPPLHTNEGASGDVVTFRWLVRNLGNGTDQFRVTAHSRNDWPMVARPEITRLLDPQAGVQSTAEVVVRVRIPSRRLAPNHDVVTVMVTSTVDPSVSDTAVAHLRVIRRSHSSPRTL